MGHEIIEQDGAKLLLVASEGGPLGSYRDAVDLVGEALSEQCAAVVIPVPRLDPTFLRLRSGLAGAFIEKMVQYRLKLAFVGDISAFTGKSEPLRDFVRESNRGSQVFFVADLNEAMRRLGG